MAPTPLPLESGSIAADGGTSAMGGQMGTISLGMLIQYINQRTYSDLLNMAEILPRKGDMEKKIDIVQFAQRTRQLYVRLLALVKWAASASKVDKCCHITVFLEKQNNLIIDTADKLFHMTKENLVHARLPHFHIPAAVETLTTGSYSRLPLTIRQRILPPEPITLAEKKQTLTRLEQIVQHRLITAELLPQMRTSKIENGRIRFNVDHEFEVSLTLMSDSPTEMWRLLEVDITVEDKATGEGKALVHPMQVGYIHQLVQSRLQDNQNPLLEVYTVLHSFCQSLQLEVLYAQTLKLLEDRLDIHIRIEEYLQGKSLTLTYWRELTHRDPNIQLGYRLTVQADPSHVSRPLMLLHTPSLGTKESEIAERAIRSDQLSIERLLVHTIYLRTKTRLGDLKQQFDSRLENSTDKCHLSGSPAVLHVPILQPCFKSEQLLISVDTHTGILLAHIPQYCQPGVSTSIMTELQSTLNGNKAKLNELISELRYWIMLRRTEKTLQHLEATAHERLPLMYDSAHHPLHTLSKHKVFITFHRHPTYILIVEFHERHEACCEIDMKMFLLVVKEASIEDDPNDDSVQVNVPKSYLRAYRLIPLDPFVCVHGPTTRIDLLETAETPFMGKRKLQHCKPDPQSKKVKAPAYFLRDIAQVVAMCDQYFPLAHVGYELQHIGVRTGGIQVEDGGVGVVVKLVDLPSTKEISQPAVNALQKHLLSASLRTTVMLKFSSPQHYKSNKSLIMEYVFTHCPLQPISPRELGSRRPVYFTYESPSPDSVQETIQAIISDWISIAKLYELVLAFAKVYSSNDLAYSTLHDNSSFNGSGSSALKYLSEIVRVRSFNYRSITLSYGPNYDAYAVIKYSTEKKKFIIRFGMMGSGVWATNAHTLLGPHLEDMMNRRGENGLICLAFLLHNSYQPLLALSKLQPTLHPGVIDRCLHPVQIFTLVPHSPTRVHIFYRNVYCLEVDFLANGLVSVRDGAFSSFQMSKAIEEFTPIKGLKAFLSKYVDESAISRRRSQSEDDNPPTPIPLEDSPWPTPKPASPARHGPITPPVSSNPHTPASPHPGGVTAGGHGNFSASPAAAGFSLSSPPSLPGMNPSPAALMSHPSPGYLGANSPSAGAHNVASPNFIPAPSPLGPHSLSSHSPASSFIAGGGSMPLVSRILPNRPYAAAIPTVLTHDAFHTLCSAPQVQEGRLSTGRCCVLEQFLGSTLINKSLQQFIRTTDSTNQPKDPNCSQIKLESLIASFSLESSPVYRLVLRLQPVTELADRWTHEEIQTLETLFTSKASSPPYKPQAIDAMFRLLCFPYKLLKDCIRIIHLEFYPPNPQQQPLKWSVQWCLTVPALGKYLIPPGQNAVLHIKHKYLFYVQLTRINVTLPPDAEPPVLVLPVVYDISTNKTQVAKKGELNMNDPADRIIQTLNELMNRAPLSPMECSVYPCIREILFNFTIGVDAPQTLGVSAPQGLPQQQQQQQQQISVQQPQQQQQCPISSSVVTPSLSSPHMTSPHMSPLTPSSGNVSSTSVTMSHSPQGPHYTGVPGGPSMGMSLPQTMGSMPMSTMGTMPHNSLTGNQMQGGPVGRGPMQNGPPQQMQSIGGMQSGMQGAQSGFGGNMMGQFPR